jgi:tetratricopeptide (TPR) repeat protein
MLRRVSTRVLGLLVFGLPLAVYLVTLCPTFYVGDSGELALAAGGLGIAHPPGYPLLMNLGRVLVVAFSAISPVAALNLSAALFAALAGLFTFLAIRELTDRTDRITDLIAAAVALSFTFSHTLWQSAVAFEVYSLSACLFAAGSFATLRFYRIENRKYLYFSGYLFGLMLANHLSAVAFIPLLAIIAIECLRLRRPRSLLITACFALLPLTIYFYLPIRSQFDLILDWYDPQTWQGFKQLVTAESYHRHLAAPGVTDLIPYLRSVLVRLAGDLQVLILVPALVGLIFLLRRAAILAIATFGVVMLNLTLLFFYPIPDLAPFFLPALFVLILWMGALLVGLAEFSRKSAVAAMLIAVVPTILLINGNFHRCDLSDRWSAFAYAHDLLQQVPERGMLFCSNDNSIFPALYSRYGEGERSDVDVYGTAATIPKLRRDLGLEDRSGYRDIPDLLEYTLGNIDRPVVLSRELIQPGLDLNRLVLDAVPVGLVTYLDSFTIRQPGEYSLDIDSLPEIYDPKEALLYAQYLLVESERTAGSDSLLRLDRAVDLIEGVSSPALSISLSDYLIRNEQLVQARRLLEGAIASPVLLQKQSIDIRMRLAEVHLRAGDDLTAEAICREILAEDPGNVGARFQLKAIAAVDAVAAGSLAEAEQIYLEMLELAPDQIDVHYQLGRLYVQMGQRDRAIRKLVYCLRSGYKYEQIIKALAELGY